MTLSRQAKVVSGVILLVVPTIMYGGVTLLGLLTQGTAGLSPGGLQLNETQWALWRAGHAHAGVWVLLSLVIQVLVDGTQLSSVLAWTARISATAWPTTFTPHPSSLLRIDPIRLLVSTCGRDFWADRCPPTDAIQ